LQPTPLRVNKIGAILRVGISENDISIYRRGTAEWHPVIPTEMEAMELLK